MDKRTILAVVLSFFVFLIFTFLGEKYGSKTPPEAPPKKAETTTPAKPAPTAPAPKAAPPEPEARPQAARPAPAAAPAAPSRPAREVVVETDLYRAVFTERGASLKSFQLKKYRQKLPIETVWKSPHIPLVSIEIERFKDSGQTEAKPKELVTVSTSQKLPLSLSWESRSSSISPDLFYEVSAPSLTLKGDDSGTLTFRGVTPEGLEVTRTYRFRQHNYAFDLKTTVVNRTSQALEGKLDLILTGGTSTTGAQDHLSLAAFADKSLEQFSPGKLKEPKVFSDKVGWIGVEESFFLSAAVPVGIPHVQAVLLEPSSSELKATLKAPETLAAGQEVQASYALYFGPKNIKALKAADLGLDDVVNFGWFDWLARPFLYVLKWLNGYIHNYGWTIIILTILLRVVLWWPNQKSMQSMKVMQKIQPRVTEIKEKYKDDKEAMNRELMSLYRTFKVNPLGGCLPMLLQLPIFLALYNLLRYSIEFRHASFIPTLPFTNIVWLADLSAKDPLLITPIIMGASMFIQQRMSPSMGDPTQAKMMMFMPLIFTVFFLNFSSGLVIYWLLNNILAIIQQYFTNKYSK
jgi:YidC/Oxa1 family membrane protein insertase